MNGHRVQAWKQYAYGAAVVVFTTAVGWLINHGPRMPDVSSDPRLSSTNILMLYLLAVLVVATRCSRGASVLASVLSVAAFDVCFVPPYLRFSVADQQYLITFGVMLVTALTISTLTHRMRQHAESAREAWQRAETEFLRNTLLSGVSHDLRTPLAAIAGAASSLIETGDKLSAPARDDMLATIYAEAEHLERLVNNLLEMTRLETGAKLVNRAPLHLQEVVGAALRRMERRLAGRSVRVCVPAELSLVEADDVALEHVMLNLIDNAIEFSPPDRAIEISSHCHGGFVELELADRGPGLPTGAEARIFDKFFRAAPADHGGHRGAGLGLAICKAIVEAHGGRIWAENRPGGGAAFHFTIPVAARV